MMRSNAILLSLAVWLVCAVGAMAQEQRHVTPVKPETNRTLTPDRHIDEKVIEQYMRGDTLALQAEARKDSLRRAYTRYPAITSWSVGLNVADLLLQAFGQDYASVDAEVTLNMWNRLQPVAQMGLGWAKTTPDDMNFTYRGKPSPYVKVGVNYNILFKHKPDYQALVGLRAGYSTFKYDITDVTYSGGYWKEHEQLEIKGERSHAMMGEVVAGVKVKLWGPISLGWMLRYHWLFNYKATEHSRPWFVPGYGPRGNRLGVSVTASYTW